MPVTPGYESCSIEILGGVPVEQLGNPTCYLGTAVVTKGPVETSVLYGLGACATVV